MLRILRLADVQKMTGLSRTSIYRRTNKGEFPKAVSLGGQSIGWREHEVDAWIESLKPVSRPLKAKPRP